MLLNLVEILSLNPVPILSEFPVDIEADFLLNFRPTNLKVDSVGLTRGIVEEAHLGESHLLEPFCCFLYLSNRLLLLKISKLLLLLHL